MHASKLTVMQSGVNIPPAGLDRVAPASTVVHADGVATVTIIASHATTLFAKVDPLLGARVVVRANVSAICRPSHTLRELNGSLVLSSGKGLPVGCGYRFDAKLVCQNGTTTARSCWQVERVCNEWSTVIDCEVSLRYGLAN